MPRRSPVSFITLAGVGTLVLVGLINVHTVFWFHSQDSSLENQTAESLFPVSTKKVSTGNNAGNSNERSSVSESEKKQQTDNAPTVLAVPQSSDETPQSTLEVKKVQPPAARRVPLASAVAVLYNRVDKCGSSSFVEMIRRASKRHEFKLRETKQYITFRTDVEMKAPAEVQRNVQGQIRLAFEKSGKFVLHGHYYLMDPDVFRPQHGSKDVAFINQVRDPVKRVISRWNYLAYGPRPDPHTKVEAINLRKSMGAPTLKEFATHPDRANLMFKLDLFPMRYYFCSAAERDECTVDRAISNLPKYTVVAVLERLDDSLAVMDYLLPGFFGGARKLFPDKKFKENENCLQCEKPDDETVANLRDMYKDDMKLFDACVAKLDQDVAALPEEVKQRARDAKNKADPLRALPARKVFGVLYNRVDKCGSTSFVEMISREKAARNFFLKETKQYVTFLSGSGIEPPEAMQKKVGFELDYQLGRKKPFVYHGHFHLLPRPEFESQVAYVNLVRDPIRRVVSRWNNLAYDPQPDPKAREEALALRQTLGAPTLSDLAQHPQRAELVYKLDMFPMRYYFCTVEQRDSCTAKAAIANLEAYMFVGVLERMDDSLALLSFKLPDFFAEAKAMFPEKKLREVGECKKCETPDEKTAQLLAELYAEDIAFYDACVKKLENELTAMEVLTQK